MKWIPIPLWNLCLVISRGAAQWWIDPRTKRHVLKARNGHLYDTALTPFGYCLKRRTFLESD